MEQSFLNFILFRFCTRRILDNFIFLFSYVIIYNHFLFKYAQKFILYFLSGGDEVLRIIGDH
jgi:hypothetical protein